MSMDEEEKTVEAVSDEEEGEGESNGAESKSRRKRSSDEEDEDEDDDAELKSKAARKVKGAKKKSKTKGGDDDNGVVCELSKNRMVAVQNFKGQTLISIREYYEKNGKMFPGHKGISLTVEQWEALKEGVDAVDAALGHLPSE